MVDRGCIKKDNGYKGIKEGRKWMERKGIKDEREGR